MPDPDIVYFDVFEDAPTRVVCMDEYFSLIADGAAPDIPITVAADVTDWDGEIPISVEGEAAA